MLLLIGVIALVACAYQSRYWSKPFDAARWQANPHSGKRVDMVDDLIRRRALDGRSRAEVVTLLGPPTRTDYFNDWDMVYWLGRERNRYLAIDSEWLVIRLDAQGRVKEYRDARD